MYYYLHGHESEEVSSSWNFRIVAFKLEAMTVQAIKLLNHLSEQGPQQTSIIGNLNVKTNIFAKVSL